MPRIVTRSRWRLSSPKGTRLAITRVLPVEPADVVGDEIEVRVFPEDRAPTDEELLDLTRDADGVVTLLCDRIDDAFLQARPRLKVVANVATGLNNVDVPAATSRGVFVCHTPGVLTDATADLTWALILAVARRLREGERLIRDGRFAGWSPTMLLGRELRGAVLGIFGFGRIGQAVAARGRAFGMEVLYASRSSAPAPLETQLAARRVELDELLARADVVSLHAPLTPKTRHVIDAATLARMKPGAILVNTSRGPLVDEAALVAALERGVLGGAGLDVFEQEPRVHPGLIERDDVVLVPHIGSATLQTRAKMAQMALADAARVLRGESPLHPANAPFSR